MSDLVIWFVLLILAAFFTVKSCTTLWRGYLSRRWPSVVGQVVSSEISSNGFGPAVFYVPKIKYKYQIDDSLFESDTYSLDSESSVHQKRIEEILSAYSPGKEIAVYYDPGCPKRSMLKNGVGIDTYIRVVLGFAILFQVVKLILDELTR